MLLLMAFVAIALFALPRVPFTLYAGLLFGPVTGTAVAISATMVSATLAFLLARAVGRDAIASGWHTRRSRRSTVVWPAVLGSPSGRCG